MTTGLQLNDNLDGTFDLEITTDNTGTNVAVGTTAVTIEARDTTVSTITGGPIAGPIDTAGTSTGTLTYSTAMPLLTAFALSNANTTNVTAVTALSAVILRPTNKMVLRVPHQVGWVLSTAPVVAMPSLQTLIEQPPVFLWALRLWSLNILTSCSWYNHLH